MTEPTKAKPARAARRVSSLWGVAEVPPGHPAKAPTVSVWAGKDTAVARAVKRLRAAPNAASRDLDVAVLAAGGGRPTAAGGHVWVVPVAIGGAP